MENIRKIVRKYRYRRRYKNVKIMEDVSIDAYCSVGEYTFIGSNSIITKSKIGRYCSIAPNVSIGLGEHIIDRVSTSSIFYGKESYNILTKGNLEIGNDVWIGTKAIILRGVKIGDGAIIGGGAVVTKDVPPFAIVAGSPAKLIKFRFSSEKISKILEVKWWEKDLEEAKILIDKLENITKF
jgi:virginiamycin A acetyltransferase